MTFIFALLIFTTGMMKCHSMHEELADGYFIVFIMTVLCIDWQNILVSLQIFAPMTVWVMSVLMTAMQRCFKMFFPRTYEKVREVQRLAAEERRAKAVQRRRERDGDFEARAEGNGGVPRDLVDGIVNEVTLLRGFVF